MSCASLATSVMAVPLHFDHDGYTPPVVAGSGQNKILYRFDMLHYLVLSGTGKGNNESDGPFSYQVGSCAGFPVAQSGCGQPG